MPGVSPASGWSPGANAAGFKIEADPVLDYQTHVFQKGQASLAYPVTSPGTVATGGTVSNTLGVDAVVYASATTGISATKVGTATLPGSALSGQVVSYLVPASSTITVSYTGTLTWVWQTK